MIRILSFDIEEWFHAVPEFNQEDWPSKESTIEAEVDNIIERLNEAGRSATFFILGDVATAHPSVIRKISDQGWEIGSHGTGHAFVHELGPEQFRQGLHKSVAQIEDVTGRKVLGYRAPMWSINRDTQWAYEALLDEGLQYDSSFYPIDRNDPVTPFMLKSSGCSILEIPAGPFWWRGHRMGMCSGIVFRGGPWKLWSGLFKLMPRHFKYFHLYFHPWELTDHQHDLAGTDRGRQVYFRLGRKKASGKLQKLLAGFPFSSIEDRLDELRALATRTISIEDVEGYDLQSHWRIKPTNRQ